MGAFVLPSDTPEYDRNIAGVREHLDEVTLHAAWAERRSMTLEQAIADARDDAPHADLSQRLETGQPT